MEYSINELSKIAKTSTRTLRYYHEIGLLEPSRINSSGYRIYGLKEVDKLQEILFYKSMGFKLEDIKNMVNSSDFNMLKILQLHKEELIKKREDIDVLIENVEKNIRYRKGEIDMSSREKFKGFKQELIKDNEDKYGGEIRDKYGDDKVDKSNKKMLGLSENEYKEFKKLEVEIIEELKKAMQDNDPTSDIAQNACKLHKKWLGYTWNFYTPEAHRNLGEMYVADERFSQYYDKNKEGMAKFLKDALDFYTK